MIGELETMLQLQAEVDALKGRIEAQTKEAKEKADKTIEEIKKVVEKDVFELVNYVKKAGLCGADGNGRRTYNIGNTSMHGKNESLYFVLDKGEYFLGYYGCGIGWCQKLGLFAEKEGNGWDKVDLGYNQGEISAVTDYICHDWDNIRASIIEDIKIDIKQKQTRELDQAFEQLNTQVHRIIM